MTADELTFDRERRVWWHGSHAGTIEPMQSKVQPWCYIPSAMAYRVPNALRREIPGKRLNDVKAAVRSAVRRA